MTKITPTIRHQVNAGSYVISNGKSQILEAYLGTCVGVNLYDVHPQIKADEIYTFLVGKPVYESIQKDPLLN